MTDQFSSLLSDYLDDELSARQRDEIEAHLETCAACRQTLAELRQVVARAGQVTDQGPARDLWPDIADRLARTRDASSLWRRRFTFTLPQAAAAGLALVLASASGVWLLQSPAGDGRSEPPEPQTTAVTRAGLAEESYDRAIADLEQVLAQGRNRLDPRTYEVIERNLLRIDRAIADARRALETDPGNVYLNNHLTTARQRKLALLRRATALAHTEG